MRILLVLLVALPALAAAQQPAPPEPAKKPAPPKDQVYKWVDKDGVVHYGDKPPSDSAKPAKLPPLQTYKGGKAPADLSKFDKGPQGGKPAAGAALVEIVTPGHDETFRGGERTVPIAVMVTPSLRDGQQLIYFVDGNPSSMPTTDTSYALTEVDRGSHTVQVAVVDAAGQEISRSQTVTFHVKPPVAKRP